MQKFTLFLLLLLVKGSAILGQAVTTKPKFPTAGQPVTLVFDLTKAKDARATGLLNKTTDVYLWSGAGTTQANAFEYQPTGQTNFAQPFAPGAMTSLGNNRWQITITPRTYFNVPPDKKIVRLGLLLKNGNGTAQTEDFIVQVYENKLNAAFKQPETAELFVEANTNLAIKAYASAAANLTLRRETEVLHNEANKDSLQYTLNTGNQAGARQAVIFEAATATASAADTFYYTIKPQPVVAALPAGLKDGINYLGNNRVILSFFAPFKEFVYVIGEFNGWKALPEYLMNKTPDGNRYWLELTNLPAGQEVAYQYLVNGTFAVADPYTEKILDPNNDRFLTAANYPNLKPYPTGANGIVSVLQTGQTAYSWQQPAFQRPASKNLIIYELLVRDFVQTRNYKTLTDTLSYFKRLGINAIELMPITEFSGNDSWGYNPIFYFAPDKAYGTQNELKAFIDACHKNGIAVILDMVLNQADYEFPYVNMYWDGSKPAANNPYFNQQATHPFSVFFDFNHESPATQSLVARVCEFWIKEYKMDGFRFDLSKGFTQKNTGGDVGAWSAYDASRVAIWKRIYDQIRAYDPTAYVILEHFADNQEEKELANYGMLFWGNLNHDYRNLAKGNNSNPNWISYKARAWEKPHVIGYMESHDEERLLFDVLQNGRTEGTYNTRNLSTALNRAKLSATFFIPVPGPKLIWQFGELGYQNSINENGRTGVRPLHWEYLQDEDRKKLFDVYAELNKLKVTYPAFGTEDFTLTIEPWVKKIVLNHPSMQVFIIGNFDVEEKEVEAGFPAAGQWFDYFTGQEIQVSSTAATIKLAPGEFHLFTSVKLPTPKAGLVPWPAPTATVTGIKADSESKDITLSPNPTQSATQLELVNNYRGPLTITLHDLKGKMLYQQIRQKNGERLHEKLDMQNLAAGMYYLSIQQRDKISGKKLVKW